MAGRRIPRRPFAIRSIVVSAMLLNGTALAAQVTSGNSNDRALAEAAYGGTLPEVHRLVSSGTAVDATDAEKRTPLMWAAFNGHTPVVAYLLEHGTKVDTKDTNGRTGLMYAASGPYAETVELLLGRGAEVNVQGTLEGFTALMTAAAEGQLEVVRLLLVHGADKSLTDKDGDTAKSFAQQKGHRSVVLLLDNPPPGR